MEENNQKTKKESSLETKKKKAKIAIISLSAIVVLFVSLQVYASTNGYGNVFFMIKEWVTGQSVSGKEEIFSDQDITLSYKSIELAEGLKIQVNRLEVKDGKTKIYASIKSQDGEPLPLKYEVTTKTNDGSETTTTTKITGTKPESSENFDYEDILTLNYEVKEDKTIVLKINNSNDKELRTLEINLQTREIIVKGEVEMSKISQIELKKYLSIFSQLNNGSTEDAQLVRVAWDIFEMNFPDEKKHSTLDETNQIIREFYGDKAVFETVEPAPDTRGGPLESIKTTKESGVMPSYQANGYIIDNDLTDYQIGLCLKISDIKYKDGIYTVKYIYTLYRKAYVEDDEIEDQPQYETTIKLKRNDNAKYSKYQVVSIEAGKEIKEKVSTTINKESEVENKVEQLEPDNYAEEVMKYEKDTKGYVGTWKVKKAYKDEIEVSLQEIYGTSVKYGVGNLFLNMDNTFGDQIAPIYESEESRAGKYISSNNSITLTYNNGSKKSISYNPVDDVITYNVFDNYYLVMERQNEQQLEPDNYAEEVVKDEIKSLYMNRLKNDTINATEIILDYRVDKVEILSDKDKKEIVKNDYTEYLKNTDTLAVVTYSVKPKDVNKTEWIAGNGEISGDWIINKTAHVCVRNGEIVFSGTGW
ncbi:MAG: hypothetical protein IKF38_00435 [Clostridia bacterium]|nr:hypothetical protein [Clostridia bacterium]